MLTPETAQAELVALRDLVQSDGWRLFRQYLATEHGPAGYGRAVQTAIAAIPHGPDRAYDVQRVVDQIDATERAVNELAEWPHRRIRELSPDTVSRRPFASLRRT